MLYASDLDELHKSQRTRDLGLVPTRYSYGVHKGREPHSTVHKRGIVTKDSYWGNTRWEYKNLNLKSKYLQCTTYILVR